MMPLNNSKIDELSRPKKIMTDILISFVSTFKFHTPIAILDADFHSRQPRAETHSVFGTLGWLICAELQGLYSLGFSPLGSIVTISILISPIGGRMTSLNEPNLTLPAPIQLGLVDMAMRAGGLTI